MTPSARLNVWALRGAVLAVVAYCIAARNIELFLIFAVVLGVRALLRRSGATVTAPAWVVNGVATLAVLWTLGRALGVGGSRLDVDSFSVLLTLLMLGKLFDWTRPRDAGQILMLSAFLGLGAVLTSNELLVFVTLVALCASLAAGAVWFQIASAERRVGADRQRGPAADGSESVGPALRRTLSMALPSVFVVSAVVFVLAPRGLGDGLFGELRSPSVGGQVTGFDDRVQLGAGGVISDSPTIVLDMSLRSVQGERRGGIQERYYLRGAVLDRYNPETGTWQASPAPSAALPMRAGRDYPLGAPKDASLVQEITIRSAPRGVSYLFSIWKPVEISFARSDQLISGGAQTHSLRRSGRGGKVTYTVYSAEQATSSVGGPGSERTREPLGIPGVRALAERILAEESIEVAALSAAAEAIASGEMRGGYDPNGIVERAVLAFAAHLRRNFAYTLAPNATPADRDPIEWFLLDEQLGHCEYFASGLVALCRSVGIGSRVVTGYIATEFNETTQHYVVRESNAHAWIEAEVAPDVWKTFDATPSADLQRLHDPSPTFLAQLGRVLDAVEYGWITGVVGFDESVRASLFGGQRIEDSRLARRAQRLARRFERGGPGLVLAAVFNAGVAFAVTVGVGWAALVGVGKLHRLRRDAARAEGAPHERLHAAVLVALRRAGHVKPPGEPLARFAAGLPDRGVGEAAGAVAATIYRGKFAGRPITPEDQAEAWRRIESIASASGDGR